MTRHIHSKFLFNDDPKVIGVVVVVFNVPSTTTSTAATDRSNRTIIVADRRVLVVAIVVVVVHVSPLVVLEEWCRLGMIVADVVGHDRYRPINRVVVFVDSVAWSR